jgi:cation transport protein ChaC
MSTDPILKITRESLSSGVVAKMVAQRDDETKVASDDELLASRREVVPDEFDCSNVWVFGYGSLIFNPVIEYTERVTAKIYGNHRRFCLRTRIGRGSPDCPGLVLALDRGGSCAGVAFKLNPETAIAELDLLWRREMITLAYDARWVKLHTKEGVKSGIAFVSIPTHQNYAPPMSLDSEAEIIAAARGFIGPCRDYLFDTVAGLNDHGIRDRHLENLVTAVKARLAL